MAAAKVVRVEDVVGDTLESTSPDLLAPVGTTDRKLSDVSSVKASEPCETGDAETTPVDGDEVEEAQDKVYPLPENWPRIKQLQRPMSCALSVSRMPCVRKAVSHLELIQNIIDEWFRRTVEEVKSRSSTRCSSSLSVQVAPKKQLRFRDPSTRSTTRTGVTSTTKSSRASSASLSVAGVGVDTPEAAGEEEVEQDMGLDIPYLGAEDVIEEVITLLARLEMDRQNTQLRFQQEMETAVTLKKKTDDLCLRRLRELPLLVQREHEACIVDLNELQWHLAYTTRAQAKSQQRKDNAEVMNNRLKEDIEFVKMHIPLVEEKLVLELQAMDRIKKAQVETNQELMTTKQRQAKTEQKSTEALSKAETERGHIRRELDNVRDNLTQISEELSTAKMTFNSYVHQVNDIGNQLVDNSQELEVLSVKDANAKAAEEMQATKVRTLQAKITDAEFECRRLENENIQAEEQLKIMKSKNAARLAELEQKSKVLEGKLRVILRHNNELSIDIEDTQEKINNCEQQKIADEKNIRRIQREIERVATMMHATTEEHISVSTINHHIRDQLHAEQEKAFRTEESLKNTAEQLRRQVKEEVHTRTVLQARINSDSAEIEKTRSESGKKKEKADKVANDVQSAVTVVLEKVEKLRAAKAKRDEQKVGLKSQIEETEKQFDDSLKKFEDRLSTITPHYNHLKDEVGQLDKVLDHMEWKTDLMNKKIEEMDGAQTMMNKVSAKTEAAVKDLLEEQAELNKQLEAIRKIGEDLKTQLTAVTDRIKDGATRHSRLLQDRNFVLFTQDDEKTSGLKKNKNLAARYRQLQNEFLIKKEQLLRTFDDRLKLETTISDIKQLKSLQSKMHGALAEYFKLSGLFNEGELTRLEHVSAENGQRVGQLQTDMEEALGLITNFLQTEMDGTRARQMAWEAVQKMEAQRRQSGAMVFAS
ncbi:coiled-coil domain-containing protein 178-like [Babylonia areolata]|uniref:coiled-coil domain-containing protein 178-like n=1 Tax=Babylonia areolata TaxID=304850 RepID=UPI003FD2888F